MESILNSLSVGAKRFLQFLFSHFFHLFKDLYKASEGIPTRYLLTDLFSIFRSAGMFTVLNLIALVVFTWLPQGKDVLLIVAEDISSFPIHVGNLFWLLIGVVFWSIASEYGTRYAIYVTDNSAHSISDQRVEWRRALQKTISQFFLMLPYLIIVLGLLINYLQDSSLTGRQKNIGFGVPGVCLYLIFRIIGSFYFDEDKRAINRDNPKGLYKFLLLPTRELTWCTKLFGIYNPFVYSIRKGSDFTKAIRGNYDAFSENFLTINQKDPQIKNFPQDPSMMEGDALIPGEFTLVDFTDDAKKGANSKGPDNPGGQYKWIYSVPLSFYKVLHRQLKVLVIFSWSLFLIICFLPISIYPNIGAPGLIVIAFGCWCGMYTSLIFIDSALLRFSKVSLRFILFLLLIASSLLNDDHPVRQNTNGTCCDNRPNIEQHFLKWFEQYKNDSANTLYQLQNDSAAGTFYPVVFICAEGGALRTGAFAAQTLSFLQDSIKRHYGIDVKESVYAFSGVSGGSLGVGFFNAAAFLSGPSDLRDTFYTSLTKTFFSKDYLSPVIGKMFYSELLQLFIPFHINAFDRAISLEKAWEEGFEEITKTSKRNIFSADYKSLYNEDRERVPPALFINTTEVESGLQCWLGNVKMNNQQAVFAKEKDLLDYKLRYGINYSTMINFSSRFPLFSPAGTLIQDDVKKFHYIDGGYTENTGAGTILEVLKVLTPVFDSLANRYPGLRDSIQKPVYIKPFVLVLKYNQENNSKPQNISFANEATEVLLGIYNTRKGRSVTALEELTRYVHQVKGEVCVLPLEKSGSEVPMNWVLSAKSLQKIEDDIKRKWDQRDTAALRNFFAIDRNYIRLKDKLLRDNLKKTDTSKVKPISQK